MDLLVNTIKFPIARNRFIYFIFIKLIDYDLEQELCYLLIIV